MKILKKNNRVKYKALKAELAILTKKIDSMSKNKSVTRFKAFMAIAEDEQTIGKAEARFSQWVEITMKKEPLPPLPKLSRAEPLCTSKDVIPPAASVQTSTVPDKIKQVTEKEPSVKAIKKKAQTKSRAVPDPSPNKKSDSSI
ncbi:hypothetical protein Tco_1188682 [Tanacetum coccineum]